MIHLKIKQKEYLTSLILKFKLSTIIEKYTLIANLILDDVNNDKLIIKKELIDKIKLYIKNVYSYSGKISANGCSINELITMSKHISKIQHEINTEYKEMQVLNEENIKGIEYIINEYDDDIKEIEKYFFSTDIVITGKIEEITNELLKDNHIIKEDINELI